ncbi:MAG: hypothetical protein WDZ59_17125 [Pirellulales bacterium]
MSTASLPYTAPSASTRTAVSAASFAERAAVFLVGLLLPAIAISPWGFAMGGLSRATMVDVMVLLTLVVLLASRRLRVDGYAILYAASLVFALVLGFGFGTSGTDVRWTAIQFIALSMALCYWVLGASIARSPALIKALMAGVVAGFLWEGVIVLHDMIMPAAWFPEADSRRTQGTFRNGGQLANYGFSAAGLVLCYGWPLWKKRSTRLMMIASALFPLLFVIAGSRRSAMAALLFWLMLYLAIGFRSTLKKAYPIILIATVGIAAWLISNWDTFSQTYFGSRAMDAYEQVESGESTFQLQFAAAMDTFWEWFPLGAGLGRGNYMTGGHAMVMQSWEIHNGHLNIAVESGLFGLVAFYALVIKALLHRWHNDFGKSTRAVRILTFTFLLAGMVFMIHNRLHRDRGFMLFMGLTSAIALAVSSDPRRSGTPLQHGQPVLILRRTPKAR